jgi:peptidoglycan hydrolase CwlO-like protein
MRRIAASLLVASTLLLAAASPAAEAKKWTVTDRLEKLSAEIDEGKQSVELTDPQIESLKKQVDTIKNNMDKAKTRNNGQISVPDERKLHRQLNDLSVRVMKLRLENVYFAK